MVLPSPVSHHIIQYPKTKWFESSYHRNTRYISLTPQGLTSNNFGEHWALYSTTSQN